jgi:hypothetical protein
MRPTPPLSQPVRPTIARAALGLALGSALLAVPATTAHAQFGKLVKRAAAVATEAASQAAAQAASDRAAATAPEHATGGAERASSARAAASGARANESRIEITPERLDAFVVAMRGPIEAAQQRAARSAARDAATSAGAAYRTKVEARQACRSRAAASAPTVTTPATLQRNAELSQHIQPLMLRLSEAESAGNKSLAAQLTDSTELIAERMMDNLQPGVAQQCGPRPQRPASAVADDTDPAADPPTARPVVPSGMTPAQFGLLRERVAAWLIGDGRRYAFTEAELVALESRRTALAPLAAHFRDRTLEWRNPLAGLDTDS